MFSGNEWIWIVVIALVLFGGSQIPKLARSLGQAQKEFKQGLSEAKGEEPAEIETKKATTD
jgi:sec-independent protein translocase protein TatA